MLGVRVAARTYRVWKSGAAPPRAFSDAGILDVFHQLHQRDAKGRPKAEVLYGRRKMTAWLTRNGFPGVSKHAVERLMRLAGMNGLVRGRKTRTTILATDSKRADDLLNRDFTAVFLNHSWVTDFVSVAAWAGFVYVGFAIDLFSWAIVGWQGSMVKDPAFVKAYLRMALWRRDHTGRLIEPGTIHHSEAGSPHTSVCFTEPVALEGLTASIGSVGDAYGNAAAETAMGLFKNEAIAKNTPFRVGPLRTIADVEEITFNWVSWNNNERFHSYLGNIPPDEYERNYYAHKHGASAGDAANKTAA